MAVNKGFEDSGSYRQDDEPYQRPGGSVQRLDTQNSVGPVQNDSNFERPKTGKQLVLAYFSQFWRSWVIILAPILLLPIPLRAGDQPNQDGKMGIDYALVAYTILLMAAYWMTEALPLAITSMLPIVLLPLLGVMPTTQVAPEYLTATNYMFIGGLMMAIAVEHSGLHQRIAFNIINLIGVSQRRLMLGFMLTTMFLSMWISNTATVSMMVPIANAVSEAIAGNDDLDLDGGGEEDNGKRKAGDVKKKNESDRNVLLLACAYASNIGGTGVITGSPPNLVPIKELDNTGSPLSFASWMAFCIPLMLVNVIIAWLWLQVLQSIYSRGSPAQTVEETLRIKRTIEGKKKNLGRMSLHELQVLILFIILVFLWFFKNPKFILGWGDLFKAATGVGIGGATPAILIVCLVFILPTHYNFWPFIGSDRIPKSSPALLNWITVEKKLPWGVIILLGGGFALAKASKQAGLSNYIGQLLYPLKDVLDPWAINLVICLATAMITEVASNTATANILVPILGDMSLKICQNPIYLMMSTAVTCSYAFMLPVATAPNAIVFGASTMKTGDMMKAGFFMNIACVITTSIAINTYGSLMFGLDTFPSWALVYAENSGQNITCAILDTITSDTLLSNSTETLLGNATDILTSLTT